MTLYLSRIHFPVTTLGPGRRIGIWFQGCSIRCKGCVSADTWDIGKGGVSIEEILTVTSTWLNEADGITISGGEPFDQPEALESLLVQFRVKTDIDILVYSGHSFEKILPLIEKFKGSIDALITDPYKENDPQTLALRGSDNQRLHCLTPLGELRFRQYDRPLKASERAFDIMFDEEGPIWLAGIPKRNEMGLLKTILAKEGHIAITTQDERLSARRPYDGQCS